MQDIKCVLFDFDGVLCKGRFYEKKLLPEHADIYDWIQANIFGDSDLAAKWMRGQVGYRYINELMAHECGLDAEWLDEKLVSSVRLMELEQKVLDYAIRLKRTGLKVGLVTDNMDVFTLVTVPHKRLGDIFDVILNSADVGLLKKDEGGRIFDIALGRLGISDYSGCVIVDDSKRNVDAFMRKGGIGLQYSSPDDLQALDPCLAAVQSSKKF
ncbi:MAG: hypothetical protein U9Q03_04100 [Patescibacteria group bacterium]|nr:hypothetical protein [Patescibacteria group bacterium]